MKKIILRVDEYIVNIYFYDDDKDISLLLEARHKGAPLSGPYSVKYHAQHVRGAVGQQHLHIYYKNNQLFALNKDGTAHDQSHGVPIPNKVAKAIRQNFPDFSMPDTNIIEAANNAINLIFEIDLLS